MITDPIVHSRYTQEAQVVFSKADALNYLYFNGHCPLDCTVHEYARRCLTTTICQHLRIVHCLTFNYWPLYTKSILYSISDSKAIFNHLRECKDDRSVAIANAWVKKKVVPWSADDQYDPDLSSDASNRVRRSTNPELAEARAFIASISTSTSHLSTPLIYQVYKFMFDASEIASRYSHHSYLQSIVLRICSMRLRMDKRVRLYEQTSAESA